MKRLMRLWLRLRYPDYCMSHRTEKTYTFGYQSGGWDCPACDMEREQRRIAKRNARIERYYR